MPFPKSSSAVSFVAGAALAGAIGVTGNIALADQPAIVGVTLQRDGPITVGSIAYDVVHEDHQREAWGERFACPPSVAESVAVMVEQSCRIRDNRDRPAAYRSGPLTVIDRQPDGSAVMRDASTSEKIEP